MLVGSFLALLYIYIYIFILTTPQTDFSANAASHRECVPSLPSSLSPPATFQKGRRARHLKPGALETRSRRTQNKPEQNNDSSHPSSTPNNKTLPPPSPLRTSLGKSMSFLLACGEVPRAVLAPGWAISTTSVTHQVPPSRLGAARWHGDNSRRQVSRRNSLLLHRGFGETHGPSDTETKARSAPQPTGPPHSGEAG